MRTSIRVTRYRGKTNAKLHIFPRTQQWNYSINLQFECETSWRNFSADLCGIGSVGCRADLGWLGCLLTVTLAASILKYQETCSSLVKESSNSIHLKLLDTRYNASVVVSNDHHSRRPFDESCISNWPWNETSTTTVCVWIFYTKAQQRKQHMNNCATLQRATLLASAIVRAAADGTEWSCFMA